MKTLYILRHAEAASGSPDDQRPLTPAGRAAAAHLGAVMREKGWLPAKIFCSPAKRTRETLEELKLSGPKPVFRPEIYQAPAAGLLAIVQKAGSAESLLLVGHNPAVHGLAAWLAGRGRQELLQAVRAAYQPGTLAVLQFKESWTDLAPGCAVLADMIVPA